MFIISGLYKNKSVTILFIEGVPVVAMKGDDNRREYIIDKDLKITKHVFMSAVADLVRYRPEVKSEITQMASWAAEHTTQVDPDIEEILEMVSNMALSEHSTILTPKEEKKEQQKEITKKKKNAEIRSRTKTLDL